MPDLFTLYCLSQRRIPALIALLAILMLFIAPEVSKTLEQGRIPSASGVVTNTGSDDMDGMDMSMMPMNNGMSHMMAAAPTHEKKGQDKHDNPTHMTNDDMGLMNEFCGYCQLFAHFPVLAWILIPLIFLLLLRSRTSPLLIPFITPVFFFPGISQPRAPPAR